MTSAPVEQRAVEASQIAYELADLLSGSVDDYLTLLDTHVCFMARNSARTHTAHATAKYH